MTRCYRLFSDNLFVTRIGAISVRYACSLRLIALLIRQFQSQNRILSIMLASSQKLPTGPLALLESGACEVHTVVRNE